MKILHVLAQIPAGTGSGVYFCNLLSRLAQRGHQQRAVYAFQGEDSFCLLPPGQCRAVEFQSDELPFPVPGMSDEMPYPSTVYAQMDAAMLAAWRGAFLRRLEAEQTQHPPDAVVLHHLWMLSALGAEVFTGSRRVGVCHNTDLRQAQLCPAAGAACRPGLARLSAVAILSPRQAPLITAAFGLPPEAMAVVGGGFDEGLFYPAPAPKAPKDGIDMLFAGKLSPSKGVFSLVRAFQAAQARLPGLRLHLVGNGTPQHRAELARLAGSSPAIHIRPAVPQAELAGLLRAADIFVLPSFYEGLALSAVEALACGLRCVVSTAGDLAEALGEEINQSGAVEYIPLPRLHGPDTPLPEDLPAYEAALAEGMLRQAGRILRGEAFPPAAARGIAAHSWQGVAARFEALLEGGETAF